MNLLSALGPQARPCVLKKQHLMRAAEVIEVTHLLELKSFNLHVVVGFFFCPHFHPLSSPSHMFKSSDGVRTLMAAL